jgi:hypothetical protein
MIGGLSPQLQGLPFASRPIASYDKITAPATGPVSSHHEHNDHGPRLRTTRPRRRRRQTTTGALSGRRRTTSGKRARGWHACSYPLGSSCPNRTGQLLYHGQQRVSSPPPARRRHSSTPYRHRSPNRTTVQGVSPSANTEP